METFKNKEESDAYRAQLEEKSKGKVRLSILIATTKDRRLMFNMLMHEFHMQIDKAGFKGPGREQWAYLHPRLDDKGAPVLNEKGEAIIDTIKQDFRHPDTVELVYIEDEKEMSIGAKRQKLLEKAKGEYIVFFDSDDYPKPNYVTEIMTALERGPDCVGFKIAMTTNGTNPQTCVHSLLNPVWEFKGGEYLRNVTHFNPVRLVLALKAGFKDIRFGEDKDYSDRVSKLCKHEVFIDKFLFDYRYSDKVEHNQKYGIK